MGKANKNMKKVSTLKEFWKIDMPDGHYVVWKSGINQIDGSNYYGFSGAVVEYDRFDGFKNYPDWVDDSDETELKVMLIEEYPTTQQLKS